MSHIGASGSRWYGTDAGAVAHALGTDLMRGLDAGDAQRRVSQAWPLRRVGPSR